MFTKTIFGIFDGKEYPVLLYLESDFASEIVIIRSMVNEYHLIQEIKFKQRDEAYIFIEMFNCKYANKFLLEKVYEIGAMEPRVIDEGEPIPIYDEGECPF